jgi:uncharacterized protein YggE
MKTIGAAALSTLALCALLAAGPAAADPRHPATLTVTGEASVTRAPDRAVVSFGVVTTNDDSSKATAANAAITAAIGAGLAKLGIPAAAITTSGYGLNYNPRPSKPDPANDQRYGYTVSRTIDVTVDAVDRAGAIVDAGVAAGASGVNGVSFGLRDPHAAQRAAQTAALADAVLQARALAAAAGEQLVRILAIEPAGVGGARPLMRMSALAASAPTTIDPGNLTVQAQVTLRYEIAPAK